MYRETGLVIFFFGSGWHAVFIWPWRKPTCHADGGSFVCNRAAIFKQDP